MTAPLRGHAAAGIQLTVSGYLLLPLVGGLTALGAGITDVVTHSEAIPSGTTRWLLCGATALTLAAIGALELCQHLPGAISRAILRIAAALAVLLIGLLGSGLDAVALLGILALIAAVQTMFGFRSFGTGLETAITDSHA